MNPDTNRFEPLKTSTREALDKQQEAQLESLKGQLAALQQRGELVRADGTPVPKHWSVFQVGEHVVIKNYTFKVAYIGETAILFEPVGPVVVGEEKPDEG